MYNVRNDGRTVFTGKAVLTRFTDGPFKVPFPGNTFFLSR